MENEIETEGVMVQPKQNITLLGAGSPKEQIARATEIADAVSAVIMQKKLFTVMGGNEKKYVHCEGWTTMGALLGCFPRITETKEIEPGRFLAVCEIYTATGHLISRGEAEADIKEQLKLRSGDFKDRWNDKYAVRSMAQTRATSKAFRIGFSWIMVLAGYAPTPAEEMKEEEEISHPPAAEPAKAVDPKIKAKADLYAECVKQGIKIDKDAMKALTIEKQIEEMTTALMSKKMQEMQEVKK
jgi:hypothetical protein